MHVSSTTNENSRLCKPHTLVNGGAELIQHGLHALFLKRRHWRQWQNLIDAMRPKPHWARKEGQAGETRGNVSALHKCLSSHRTQARLGKLECSVCLQNTRISELIGMRQARAQGLRCSVATKRLDLNNSARSNETNSPDHAVWHMQCDFLRTGASRRPRPFTNHGKDALLSDCGGAAHHGESG